MLTNAQLTTLKVDILADPALAAQPNTADGAAAIADAYSLIPAPAFIVWRTDVPTKDVKKAVVWTEFIGRSAGEREAFVFMLSNGTINPADINVRQGINDCFSGPSGLASRTALLALGKRSANRIEKLLATGQGLDATPATMGYEGTISYLDVLTARNLP